MRQCKHYLLFGLLLLAKVNFAQYFEINWSEKERFSNNKDGFFSEYINTSESYMYVLKSNLAKTKVHQHKKLKLVAYSKYTMSLAEEVALKGFPENKGAKTVYDSLNYCKTIVSANRVMVFWIKCINTDSTKIEEVFVESFQSNLERDKSLRKVFTSIQKVDKQAFLFAPSNVVIVGSRLENVLVGSEIHETGKKVVLKYVLLNEQLSPSTQKEFSLVNDSKEEFTGLISEYDYASDENVYVRSRISYTKDEILKRKANEAKFYLNLTVINPNTNKSVSLDFNDPEIIITDFSYAINEGKTNIFGFFGDLKKDPYGLDKQGIFYTEIKTDLAQTSKVNYTYFENASLKKLFPKSKGGRKKKIVPPTEEELNTFFDIERVFLLEDSSTVLFFTRKYNYTETTGSSDLNGRDILTTTDYCEKNNLSAIRISHKGKILWTSNIERSITYEGTDVRDVNVVFKYGKYYVMFGAENVDKYSTKKEKHPEWKQTFDYATFDPTNGRAKKLELEVNETNTPEKEKKSVNTSTICVYDNNFYFSNVTTKLKPLWLATNIVLFPSVYYSILSGNTKVGKGELGIITLQEGKPNKKRK